VLSQKLENKKEESIAWTGLREIYRLLGTEEGNRIVEVLLKNEFLRSSDLQIKSEIPASKFHTIVKALVQCLILDRNVQTDRSVSYSISPFGKNVLKLSEPLLKTIKETFNEKQPEIMLRIGQNK
jgi:hypothetical protein